jgi:hypothetical protein
MDKYMLPVKMEETFEWNKWIKEIPSIQFRSSWKVKIIPPFGGAVVRFHVTDETEKAHISVYLDCYNILGHFGKPYWEIYPYDGDVYRVGMNDVEELFQRIQESIDSQLQG